MTFVNDVAITPDGSAYSTDSMNQELYLVLPNLEGGYEFEQFLNFEGTVREYDERFNLNGIAASEDDRYLVTVKSNTGELYRIDPGAKEVSLIDTGGVDLTNGDGILLDSQILYIVRNRQKFIVPVELSEDFSSDVVGEMFADESLAFLTTITKVGHYLLAVNGQFDRRESRDPAELPFSFTSVTIPE